MSLTRLLVACASSRPTASSSHNPGLNIPSRNAKSPATPAEMNVITRTPARDAINQREIMSSSFHSCLVMRGMVRIALNHIETFMGLSPFQGFRRLAFGQTPYVQGITNYITATADKTRLEENRGWRFHFRGSQTPKTVPSAAVLTTSIWPP